MDVEVIITAVLKMIAREDQPLLVRRKFFLDKAMNGYEDDDKGKYNNTKGGR